MKLKRQSQADFFSSLVVLLFLLSAVGTFAQPTNVSTTPVATTETWESISNRWGKQPFDKIREAAEQGDASAQYFLGWAYWDGLGVAVDKSEALKWYKKSADQGLANAEYRMGYLYHYGMGVETNAEKAIAWFRKSASKGYASAELDLGIMFYCGEGMPVNFSEAAKYYRLSAEHGNQYAANNLGYVYGHGQGVPKDLSESIKWYRQSAGSGFAEAQMNLGYAYEHGEGSEINYLEAARYYRLAAEQGQSMAQNNLGFLYYRGLGVARDINQAMEWYAKSAEQGQPWGQSNLGWMYEHGDGVEHNHTLALKWTKAAAEQGFAKAQLQMGDLLENQFDSDRKWIPDHAGATAWYTKAATQGEVEAMMKVGDLYFHQNAYPEILKWYGLAVTNGNMEAARKLGDLCLVNRPGHPLDHRQAADWYRVAAEKDDEESQYQLGCLLVEGNGITHDPAEAELWLRKSAENGYVEAALKIASLHHLPASSIFTNFNMSRTNLEISGFNRSGITRLPLGVAFEEGKGGDIDLKQAINAYCWILNLGPQEDKPEALNRMVNLYATGRIKPEPMARPADFNQLESLAYYYEMAPKDTSQLVDFLAQRKSQITSAIVLYHVGEMFEKGINITSNKNSALIWYRLAANAGNPEASKKIRLLEDKTANN